MWNIWFHSFLILCCVLLSFLGAIFSVSVEIYSLTICFDGIGFVLQFIHQVYSLILWVMRSSHQNTTSAADSKYLIRYPCILSRKGIMLIYMYLNALIGALLFNIKYEYTIRWEQKG